VKTAVLIIRGNSFEGEKGEAPKPLHLTLVEPPPVQPLSSVEEEEGSDVEHGDTEHGEAAPVMAASPIPREGHQVYEMVVTLPLCNSNAWVSDGDKKAAWRATLKRHHAILSAAVIVKYVVEHSQKDTVVKIQPMKDTKRTKNGHKVELSPKAINFFSVAGSQSTFKWIKKADNFWLKLKSAVWACDAHWSEERPAYYSESQKGWEPHRNTREEMFESLYLNFLNSETATPTPVVAPAATPTVTAVDPGTDARSSKDIYEFFKELVKEEFAWALESLYGTDWRRHFKEGRGGECWTVATDGKDDFDIARILIKYFREFRAMPQKDVVAELAKTLWKMVSTEVLQAEKDLYTPTVESKLTLIRTIRFEAGTAINMWIDAIGGSHGAMHKEMIESTFAYTDTESFKKDIIDVDKKTFGIFTAPNAVHPIQFKFEMGYPSQAVKAHKEFEVLVRCSFYAYARR
jgi:hypothetical protein